MECCDGSGNPALHCGSKETVRLYEARLWLENANYTPAVYNTLLHGILQLYESYVPYQVEWKDMALNVKPATTTRMVFIAYNPDFKSLSPTYIGSQSLVSKLCAANCMDCSVSGPGSCDECVPGSTDTRWEGQPENEICSLCPPNCAECYFHDQCIRCDTSFWTKYISDDIVQCKACGDHCSKCDSDVLCETCEMGYGLTKAKTCEPCRPYCMCLEADKCDSCVVGYGVSAHGMCTPCMENCKDCDVADKCLPDNCAPGYTEVDAMCYKCGSFCLN